MPKQEYGDAISNIDLRWIGVKVSAEEIDEEFSSLLKMVWAFQRSLDKQLFNLDEEAGFKAKLYENIYLDTANAIFEKTHCPNRVMHKIITLSIFSPCILRINYIDKNFTNFKIPAVMKTSILFFRLCILHPS